MKQQLLTLIFIVIAALNAAGDNPPPTPPPPPETIPVDTGGKGKDNDRSDDLWLPMAIYDAAAAEVYFSCIYDEGETWLLDRANHIVGYYPGLNGEISTLGLPAGLYTIVFLRGNSEAYGSFTIRN